ncbi:hypothetical protein U1Q18_050789, partial [Sarracenia purpurea var. burkii]
LKKEEEERRAKKGSRRTAPSTGKVGGPDLKSFIQQFPVASEGDRVGETSDAIDGMRNSEESDREKKVALQHEQQP